MPVLFVLLVFAGCRAPLSEENLARLADLEKLVTDAQYNLNWDQEDLQQRVDSMDMKLDYISAHMRDSGDLKINLLTYKAIQANYKTYIEEAPALDYDLDKYRKEIIKMKEDALSGKINNAAFEKKYTELRPPLTIIAKTTEPISHNILSVEPEYQRQNRIITEKYKALGGK
jgi:hypothetical protein